MDGTLEQHLKAFRCVDPDVLTATAHNGAVIDTKGMEEILFIFQVGALGSNATFAGKIQHGDASNLSDAADLTGAAITTLTQASPDGSDQLALVRVRISSRTVKRYIRAVATVAAASSDGAVVAVARFRGEHPLTQPSDVAETVTV